MAAFARPAAPIVGRRLHMRLMAPSLQLSTGHRMPSLGFGTWGADAYNQSQIGDAVSTALRTGYRHLDCASVYGNEKEVGAAIRDSGVARENLFITSKVWNDQHDDVEAAFNQSLADLGTDYLDLYLIHWPFAHGHSVGARPEERSSDAKPFSNEEYLNTWRQLERLHANGRVRSIGVANLTVRKLAALLPDCHVKPAVNQVEAHPHLQQPDLLHFCNDLDITLTAACPLGSPDRPTRDRTSEDPVVLEDPTINTIAEELNVTPAQVCLRWAIQRRTGCMPKAVLPDQIKENFEAQFMEPLTSDHMAQIGKADRNHRLIKGQVFCWKEGQPWQELWDEA